jgi:integrase
VATVNQRLWKVPGQRTKRKAWGYTAVINGKRVKSYKTEWSKEQAEEALAKALLQIKAPKAEGSGITFAEAKSRYLAAKARKKSISGDARYLTMFESVFGAETPLVEITGSRISGWKSERLSAVCPQTKEPYKAAAVNRPLALLRHLLRVARDEWEVLSTVPKIKLEREGQGRLRWLTEEEIVRLLCASLRSRNPELHAAVVIAINTGLRRAELLGLTWDRVDRSRGVIRLEITKSGRRREVPLNDDSDRALVSLGPKAAGRVFQTRSIRTAFENAVETAKLDDVTFHTLRHTFASWAMMRGVSLREFQELLGHSSLAMTMRYAHLAPEHLRTAVSRLAGLIGGKVPAEVTEDRAQARAHEVVSGESLVRK